MKKFKPIEVPKTNTRETEVIKCGRCGERYTVPKYSRVRTIYRAICTCGAKLS